MAREWKVGAGVGPGGLPTLPGSAWRPWSGPMPGLKKEKVVNPRAGFNPKPGVGLGRPATISEMDKYGQSFTPEKTEKTALAIKMD